jgi:hypothetical protein
VRRLALLVVLGVLVWYYFPDSRMLLLDLAQPVLTPVQRWSAEEEMSRVARNVVEHERLTGRLPTGEEWLGWLEYRYSSEDLRSDPWGSVYQLEVLPDSVVLISFGPDRTRATPDDVRVSAPRR